MEDLFTRMILGHLVSDYLLQPKEMATQKGGDKTINGTIWCFLHCIVYTGVVALFMWNFDPKVMFLVFASHYPIDRFSLGEEWLKVIKARSVREEYFAEDKLRLRPVLISFASIIYVVADNTMHFLLLYGISLLIKSGMI